MSNSWPAVLVAGHRSLSRVASPAMLAPRQVPSARAWTSAGQLVQSGHQRHPRRLSCPQRRARGIHTIHLTMNSKARACGPQPSRPTRAMPRRSVVAGGLR
jgi:hypothetical protein